MAEYVNAVLPPLMTSSDLQLNYGMTIIENHLKSSQTEVLQMGIQQEATSRWVGGVEMQNRLVSYPHEPVKNWEGYPGCGGHLRGGKCPSPISGSPVQVQVLVREVPKKSGCENHQSLWLSETFVAN